MTSGSPSPGERLCLVEDDPQVLQAMTAYLRSVGYRVRGFTTGQELLDFWEWSVDVDCIISDVRLPDIDGLALLRDLRKRGAECPIILITGHGDVTMAVSAMKAGATDFIEKPLDTGRLKDAISEALSSRAEPEKQDERAREVIRRIEAMSERHKEILGLVAQGLTSKEIGQRLKLSFRTVESHRASIMDQLGARNLADLIRLASHIKQQMRPRENEGESDR